MKYLKRIGSATCGVGIAIGMLHESGVLHICPQCHEPICLEHIEVDDPPNGLDTGSEVAPIQTTGASPTVVRATIPMIVRPNDEDYLAATQIQRPQIMSGASRMVAAG
jgi:hypothetical protein